MSGVSNIPNLLTVGRILTVPPLVWLLLNGQYQWALALAVAAGGTDLLDGWLARRFGWQSRFGGLADPLADKFLLVASYITLAWLTYLPWWLVALVLLRDLVIVIGGVIYHFVFENVKAEPTRLSKFNTACQVGLMWYVLIRLAMGERFPLPEPVEYALIALVAVMTAITLLQYVWVWSNKAAVISRSRKAEAK